MPTPKERAYEVLFEPRVRDLRLGTRTTFAHEALQGAIAEAILAAENEALERAAREVITQWTPDVGGYPTGSELAAAIRALKSKVI